jgi:hypothetical protein
MFWLVRYVKDFVEHFLRYGGQRSDNALTEVCSVSVDGSVLYRFPLPVGLNK